ncbi:Leucine-rich repeat serine/threonine-protein kinase 2 [Phytophthora boehmeriae]|uniref:Leucine-rich repeat serine/threonine-protein kinase 2 n=1 Tax=Phytophthora boehmeriae TaxID=109152 RepID=A0A8T1W4D7_9STRA|nr:Leucine-rich repeat serine/threonine-protein kinase 2 [Phytophthora boehmeriae]
MVVQDLACPGFGSVVQVLQTILKICMEIKEVQESAKRLHGRLSDIFSELVKMENEGNLPKTEVLDKYVAVLARSLDCIQRYQKKKLVYRVLRYRQMMDKIFSINEEVDMLFNVFHLASTAAMMDWKKQYYEDQRVQKEMMNSLVINSMEVMKGMDDSRKQQEALFALQFEKQKGDNQQDKEMERIVKTMEHTIVQASKATVGQLPAWYLPADEVKYEEEPFARGSFAFVYRGVWGHGTKVVVKCFNVEAMGLDEATMKTIKKEMDVWYKFNHPNVIKMFGASHVTSPPFIVCEAANGDLRQFFARSEANKQQMWRMLYEAALGLDYIHKMKVVHGDLKLNNILVSSDRHAKLSDFGLSSVRNSSTMSKVSNADETAGALRWRAPECLLKAPNFASDVYSFAMCIIEAISDGPPFHGLDDEAVRENLRAGNIPDRPEEMPDDVWKLVEDMTSKDPSKRISLAHVIKKLEAFDQHEFTEELPGGATYCSNCSSPKPPQFSKREQFAKSEDPQSTVFYGQHWRWQSPSL